MTLDLTAAAAGLGTGLSLIIAIGAQNSFVLRQGLRREHVPAIVAVCAVSDLVLIACGVAGLGALVTSRPTALTAIAWIGGLFLVTYGVLAARRALRPSALIADDAARSGSMAGSVLTCMGLTWLNPHVYLDTVLLIGSIAAGYGSGRWMFAVGAGSASVLWFSALGFGARLARPLFARPAAWRLLDIVIAATMVTIGVSLVLRH